MMCLWLPSVCWLLCFRLKIWLEKLNGPLRKAWSMWAGWTQRRKKQQKKRWEKDSLDFSLPVSVDITIWYKFCWAVSCAKKPSTATWCENMLFTVFLFFSYLSQADAIYNMVGYPEFIMNSTKLDKVFNDVGKCGTVLYVLTAQTSNFASLKRAIFLSLPPCSLRWYQIFTSKTSCSTTTSRPEWLRTSWGKLPTETSESLPHPHLPTFQRGGCTLRRGHIPVVLTQQNAAAIHKCSQATRRLSAKLILVSN